MCSHTHHQQAVIAQRVAGNSGEVVVMAEDTAAIALPPSMAPHQAEVPGGRHSVRAVGEPPQSDVDRRPQDMR